MCGLRNAGNPWFFRLESGLFVNVPFNFFTKFVTDSDILSVWSSHTERKLMELGVPFAKSQVCFQAWKHQSQQSPKPWRRPSNTCINQDSFWMLMVNISGWFGWKMLGTPSQWHMVSWVTSKPRPHPSPRPEGVQRATWHNGSPVSGGCWWLHIASIFVGIIPSKCCASGEVWNHPLSKKESGGFSDSISSKNNYPYLGWWWWWWGWGWTTRWILSGWHQQFLS